MCVLSIKVPIRKKSGNLSYAPRKIKKFLFKHLSITPVHIIYTSIIVYQ